MSYTKMRHLEERPNSGIAAASWAGNGKNNYPSSSSSSAQIRSVFSRALSIRDSLSAGRKQHMKLSHANAHVDAESSSSSSSGAATVTGTVAIRRSFSLRRTTSSSSSSSASVMARSASSGYTRIAPDLHRNHNNHHDDAAAAAAAVHGDCDGDDLLVWSKKKRGGGAAVLKTCKRLLGFGSNSSAPQRQRI